MRSETAFQIGLLLISTWFLAAELHCSNSRALHFSFKLLPKKKKKDEKQQKTTSQEAGN